MEITNTTNPVETNAVETEVDNDHDSQINETQAASEGDEPDSQADESEFDEVEVDGKTYRVPKEIAPHVMKNADYTQKTQTLAEQRREWEAQVSEERERIQFENETFEQIKGEEAQRVAIHGRMEALRQVNFGALGLAEATRYNNEMMQLQWAFNDLSANIENKKHELQNQRESEASNAWYKTVEALSRPDEKLGWAGKFDEAAQARLADIATKELGVPQHRLRTTMSDPIAVKALNLVAIGLETLKRQKAALTAKPKLQEAVPITTVGGNKAKGSVNPDTMPMDQWVKFERSRMAKQKAR